MCVYLIVMMVMADGGPAQLAADEGGGSFLISFGISGFEMVCLLLFLALIRCVDRLVIYWNGKRKQCKSCR